MAERLMEKFWINDSQMPVRLGSALKVPSYAYPNWGVEGPDGLLRTESDRGYEVEWLGLDGKGGSAQQMKYVVEAITSTGLGNYSQMLRDKGAQVVSWLVRNPFAKERVNYLESGAGVSTEFVLKQLKSDGVDLERVFFTLIEPGKGRIEGTAAKLESEYGFRRDKNFRVVVGRDLDIPQHVEPGSQHIALAVAAHHHHAYLDKPTKSIADALDIGGFFVVPDWHNSMWEHPNRVYRYLQEGFDWPIKERDLSEFVRAYPKALEPAPEDPLNEASNIDIRKFWKGWEVVRSREVAAGRFNPNDDILMLEGHRPVERYVDVMEEVGLCVDNVAIEGLRSDEIVSSNPHKVLGTDSRILMVTIGEKV